MNYTIDEICTALEQLLDARERIPADREFLLALSLVAERILREMLAKSAIDSYVEVQMAAINERDISDEH